MTSHDPDLQAEIDRILGAAKRQGLTRGVEAIYRALSFQAKVTMLVGDLTPVPPDPSRADQPVEMPAPARKAPAPNGASAPARPAPGAPTAPVSEAEGALCRHVDQYKGPCQREPHDPTRTRHRYAKPEVSTRLASVDPEFSDAPKRKPARDMDGHALITGSNVVSNGSHLSIGWTGKVVEVLNEREVLVYGQKLGKTARPAEHVVRPESLRWVAASDVPKAG